jgi:hypothetical protein
MDTVNQLITTERLFTGLFAIGAVYAVTKLVPLAFSEHKAIITKIVLEHKEALTKVTDAFLQEIRNNNEWRTGVDNHLRDHTKQLEEINVKLQK